MNLGVLPLNWSDTVPDVRTERVVICLTSLRQRVDHGSLNVRPHSSKAEADRRRLPRYPVPCFRMGRLGCRIDQRGRGLGKLLVGCAVDRCLKAREQVAAYALIVDAKDETAKRFYEHFGFRQLMDRDLTLCLPLGR